MRALLITLLLFSLSTIVQATSSPEKVVSQSQKKKEADSGTMCDPKETSKMPETFY